MKRIFVIVLMAALLVPCFLFSGKKTNAKSVFDELSFPGSENIISMQNLFFKNESNGLQSIGTHWNIFLSDISPIMVQVDYSNCGKLTPEGYDESAVFEFYTIDGIKCGTFEFDGPEILKDEKNKEYDAYYISNVPENAFSLKIVHIGILCDDFYMKGGYITGYYGSECKSWHEFKEHAPLIEVDIDNIPSIEVSYDNHLTNDDILEMIGCYDGISGNLKQFVSIDATSYLNDPSVKGEYPINITVNDGTNEVQSVFYINVVDKMAPVIIGKDEYRVPIGTTLDESGLLCKYQCIDECDGDCNKTLKIASDYENESSTPKMVSLTISGMDESGNVATKTISVIYYDNIAPIISGPDTISYGYQVNMDLDMIISENYTITDNVDSNPTYSIIKDKYSGNERSIGTYEVVISAKDESKNSSTKTITIKILDDVKPIIYLDTYAIEASPSIVLSSIDFSNILYKSGELKKGKKYQMRIINDTYTGHEKEEGTYVYQVEYTSDDGDSLMKTFKINVDFDTYSIDYNAVKNVGRNVIILSVLTGFFVSTVLASILLLKKKKNYR